MSKLFRLTFAFDEPKQGWSENWYFQRDTALLVDLLDEFQNLANLRAAMLGSDASLTHIRVSQVLDTVTGVRTPRLSQGRDVIIKSNTSRKLCAPHDSLLARCITSDQLHRKDVYLGGVWAAIFDELRHYQSVGDFQTRFDTWANEVKARGLGWLSQTEDEVVDVTGYTSSALTGRTTLDLSGPITFNGKPPVRRASVNFPGGHETLDGVYLVGPVVGQANQAITVKPRPSHAFDGRVGVLKTYRLNLVTLGPTQTGAAPARIDIQRMARRNRGKALYAEAGRRPAILRF